MDGVLVVDKPSGITSHDVVAVARRALGEKRIGHCGTLDPLATGVLALACGRATRLVRFLSASDKEYEATIRFGLVTDSYDITGKILDRSEIQPERTVIEQAIRSLCGEYLQMPPPFSAKKVDGRRAYALARLEKPVALKPSHVRVERAVPTAFTSGSVTVAITCSAGFYVRSFAHQLGQDIGTGACLEALRRTRSGDFTLRDAVPLEALTRPSERERVAGSMIPMRQLLPELTAVRVTATGRGRLEHGQAIAAADYALCDERSPLEEWVRVVDSEGCLVAIAQPGNNPGALHPTIVLI